MIMSVVCLTAIYRMVVDYCWDSPTLSSSAVTTQLTWLPVFPLVIMFRLLSYRWTSCFLQTGFPVENTVCLHIARVIYVLNVHWLLRLSPCVLLAVQNWHQKYRSFRETVFAFVSGVRAFHVERLNWYASWYVVYTIQPSLPVILI